MRLGLVLAGSLEAPLPSTRVALLNLLPALQQRGFTAEVLHAPARPQETPDLQLDAEDIRAQGIRLVIFQKVYGQHAVRLAQELESRGVRTVFLVCDRVVPEMAAATSATVCVTEYLASLYPAGLMSRMRVVHDGVERPELRKGQWRADRGSRSAPLRAVLVTSATLHHLPVLVSPPPWLRVDVVGNYPERRDWVAHARSAWRSWRNEPRRLGSRLRMFFHPRVHVHRWGPDSVYQHLIDADIGIIPIEREPPLHTRPAPAWAVKSENRLTLKMAAGLPVVATPIPAYEAALAGTGAAMLVESRREWLDALEQLRDPRLRHRMGEDARRLALERFSLERQASLLEAVLRQVGQATH